MAPVRGGVQQMGCRYMYFRGLFLPSCQQKLSKEGIQIQNNDVRHLHFKISADMQMMAQGWKEKME